MTESAVYDSASSSAVVRSVRGSPAEQGHKTGLHTLPHPLTRPSNLRQAPTHSAAPVRTAAKEKHEMRGFLTCLHGYNEFRKWFTMLLPGSKH